MCGSALPPLDVVTVNAALARAARGAHGLVFVDAGEHERVLPWNEVQAGARRMAGALAERGVQPGDRVAMVLPTGPDFMDAFFGTLLAGAVPVPLYPPVRLGRMEEYVLGTARMLEVVGARVLLSDARTRLLLGEAVARARPALGCPTVADLLDGASGHEVSVEPEALGLIQFSSGSTVDPRPVALTHHALIAQVAALKALLPAPPGSPQTGVSWLPLYHDMGLVGCLLEALYYPATLVLIPPELFLVRPALWLRALSRHRGVVSPAPNFAYGLCCKRIRDDELEGVDLGHWRYALNGAEPIAAGVQQAFATRFARVGFRAESLMPVYGLSECALAATFTSADGPKREISLDAGILAATGRVVPGSRRVVSVGTPIPGAVLDVRDDAGVPCAEGEVGRVWIRAPFVMKGYFDQPQATDAVLRDGWLDTGDVGLVDGGELFITGRVKDVVIIRGANHAPQTFEDCLAGIENLRAGCAVALGVVPPGQDTEALLVLAECSAAPPAGLEERIVAAIVEHTSIVPHAVVLLAPGTLPRTSSGKLRRGEALRRYCAGELTAPAPVTRLRLGAHVARSLAAFARLRLDR
ncbi:MAG: AMP-dependent synthetase [Gemmatimonas sp.]|nr:AMP-dependent synthetase [Gemmatimonas sp.]